MESTTPTAPGAPPSLAPAGRALRWSRATSMAMALGLVLVAAAGMVVVPRSHLGGWAAVISVLTLMIVVVGRATTGRAAGALIDRRNRFSLSRLQLLAWTVLVPSAAYVACMANIGSRAPDPLRVDVPQTLWALMGLGVTSAVGAPMIREAKTRRKVDPGELHRAMQSRVERAGTSVPADCFSNVGPILVNRGAEGASFSDLLTGDEVGDAPFTSLGKLQFALVSMLVLILYAAALAGVLGQPAPIRALPALDNGLVTLMGISHAGYLAHQAAPQSLSPA
ncbi:hypothetical protein [Tautonia plasticadhaerens]|uniref:Uncharacterized protein n=1 Tax=Tautonia plasticadhaerens TaxID=2527974 RepID=A0A518H4Y8_9BACT|nr:hypothetical protein [Tautonia plasticadhaerens]QDV35878.1 hypothetical protein ElP_37860 [Tautonia plasticadhaerens]